MLLDEFSHIAWRPNMPEQKRLTKQDNDKPENMPLAFFACPSFCKPMLYVLSNASATALVVKSRFLLESIIGPRTLDTALQLTASVAVYSKACPERSRGDKCPPLILIDDHLPYPQAILQVFGQIKHCRRKNGRGRFKHPRLKPHSNLQVGVVKKLRDDRGNLLKVSSKALFGRKKEIIKRVQKLGIGRKINTSHIERLNGTIRGQQARLKRRTRAGSHLEEMLQYSIWLWRDLYNWTRVHYSLLDETPAMALGLADEVWTVLKYILYPVHVCELMHIDWAERRNSVLESAIDLYKRNKNLPIS